MKSISAEEIERATKTEECDLKYFKTIIREQECKIKELSENLSHEENKFLKIKDKFKKYRETFVYTAEQYKAVEEKLYMLEFYQQEDKAQISKLKTDVRDLQRDTNKLYTKL